MNLEREKLPGIIQPKPPLKQLPVLEGYVPEGWKQAIYINPKSETKEKRTMSIGKKRNSNFGSAKGLIVMGDDFDQPLDDFKE